MIMRIRWKQYGGAVGLCLLFSLLFGPTIVKSITNPESGRPNSTAADLSGAVSVTYDANTCGGSAVSDGNGVRISSGDCESWSVVHTPQNCHISWGPSTVSGTGSKNIRARETCCGDDGQSHTPCCPDHSYKVTFVEPQPEETGSGGYELVINGQPTTSVIPEDDLQFPCVNEGGACSGDNDCCEGLVCEDGICQVPMSPEPSSCSGYMEPCTTTADCCSGLICSGGSWYPSGP
jgi:hypothetical protein